MQPAAGCYFRHSSVEITVQACLFKPIIQYSTWKTGVCQVVVFAQSVKPEMSQVL